MHLMARRQPEKQLLRRNTAAGVFKIWMPKFELACRRMHKILRSPKTGLIVTPGLYTFIFMPF